MAGTTVLCGAPGSGEPGAAPCNVATRVLVLGSALAVGRGAAAATTWAGSDLTGRDSGWDGDALQPLATAATLSAAARRPSRRRLGRVRNGMEQVYRR